MQIDAQTIQILKNFAKINPSIAVKKGNVLTTISPSKTILAKAQVTTTFDSDFAIYYLDRFISTLSLFKEPNLTFGQKSVTISDGDRKINYSFADESFILKAPENGVKLPSVDVQVDLTDQNLQDVVKAMNVLGLPEIIFTGDGKKVYIQAADSKKATDDSYSIVLGDTDKEFSAVFKAENVKIIPGNYTVKISSKGIAHFAAAAGNLEYWMPVEKHSKF